MTTRLFLAMLAALALGLGPGAGVATAAGGESVPSFDAQVDVDAHGDLRVIETIEYDFGTTQQHGLRRELATRVAGPGGTRLYRVSDVQAWGPAAGVPAPVVLEPRGDSTVVQVGYPQQTVTGRQTYVLRYVLRGAWTRLEGATAQDEVSWDVTGTKWAVPIDRVTVWVRAARVASGVRCLRGHAAAPCTATSGSVAGISAGGLVPGESLAVTMSYPVGTVADLPASPTPPRAASPRTGSSPAGPRLTEQLLAIGQVLVVVAGLVVLGLVARAWTPDRRSIRRAVSTSATGVAPAPADPPGTTPLDLRPGQLAVLHAGRAEVDAVVATLLDLAAQGFLTVEEQPGGSHRGAPRGWTLVRARSGPHDSRLSYEDTLLHAVFRNGDRVAVDDLNATLAPDLGRVQDQLLDDGAARGWFRPEAVRARNLWHRLDRARWTLSLAAGVLVIVPVLRPTPADALPVVGCLVAATGCYVLGRIVDHLARRPLPRSAAGDAVLADTSGFRNALAAARDERWGRTPRTDDLLSRSLPYAVALGLAEPWSDVVARPRRSGFTWVVTDPAAEPGARG